jgi:phosphatidylinositol alpha-mannosyltransferase
VRIALACPYAWDLPGGVQQHIRELAADLERRGHDVLVLTPAHRATSAGNVQVVGRIVRVPFNGSVAPIGVDPRSLKAVKAALGAFVPDVVHVHEPFAPSTSLLATIVARAPVVATSHTFSERSPMMRVASPLLGWAWRRPVIWISVSSANEEFVRRYLAADVRVIPNGLDLERFRHVAPAPLPPGRYVLFVGRMEPRKGFRFAVQAFAILAGEFEDLRLLAVGEGSESTAVDELPPDVRARVELVGVRTGPHLPPYHAAAEVFVSPAPGRESFGLVLIEAMAAGVPVVASDIAGYREVVRKDVDGLLVPPEDPRALAAAVRRILLDPGLAAQLTAAGRERAQGYSWEAVGDRIVGVYEEALSRPRS